MRKQFWIVLWCCAFATSLPAATTINSANRFAFGANIGWLNWQADVANGAVIGEYVCSGLVFAANVGWISLGSGSPVNGIHYQNNAAGDCGINHDGLGNLRGLAWGANIGWVTFETQGAPKVNLKTGRLSGFVWGANIGWISLSNAAAFVQTDVIRPAVDSDADGIADAWELIKFGNLATANATSDADGDGFSDAREYLSDTDPLDPTSYLRITAFAAGAGGSPVNVSWSSRETRCYYILETPSLNPPVAWSDSGLGLITPDAGPVTVRNFVDPASPERFLKIEAVKPLLP